MRTADVWRHVGTCVPVWAHVCACVCARICWVMGNLDYKQSVSET